MTNFSPRLRAAGSILSVTMLSMLLNSCMTNQPQLGGFSSLIVDPANALKDEPAPIRPNSHMDPVIERNGAFNLKWIEDLQKTATNDEVDPDGPSKKRKR